MSYSVEYFETMHKFSFKNQQALENSSQCGCFNCLTIFPAKLVTNWMAENDNQGNTGWCPICEMDSLIGDIAHVVDKSFFYALRGFYFASESNLDPVIDAAYIRTLENGYNKQRKALGLPDEDFIP